jgi:HEPN domain-containing protein
MTQAETVAHWRKGATDSLELAELAHGAGKYALALFHCQLAVEKALKVAIIAEQDAAPPPTHDLLELAHVLQRPWTDEQQTLLDVLSDFAILARYGGEEWEEAQATERASALWLSQSKQFLTLLFP